MQAKKDIKRNIEIKKESVEELNNKIAGSSTVVFTDYQGMTMPQLSELRSKLLDIEAEFTVTKNTLTTRALKSQDKAVDNNSLEGPTATLFAKNDPVEAVKALFTFAKANQLPKVKFGLFDGRIVNDTELEQISKLPGKNELLGQVVAGVGGPLYGLVGTLSGTLSSLVMTIKAIETQKGGE
jgi:large subunit ribosomal protein L10